MSFAKTFDDIFVRLFGALWQKPRLRRIDGKWVCSTLDGKTGRGLTPGMAYGAWCALVGK